MKEGEIMKWSKEKIIEYVNNTDKYIFIEFLEYNGISSLIKVECKKNKKHGSFDVKFNNLKSNEDRKIRDTIKNIYCQQNNIKLIRIPYWDFNNIEQILKQELNLI